VKSDYFALLGEPRRLWRDPEEIKSRFLERSAAVHPDRVHTAGAAEKQAAQDAYVELNRAWQTLSSPKDRLRHWLELETGAVPAEVQEVSNDLAPLFMELHQQLRGATRHIQAKEQTASPLLKAGMMGETQQWMGKLQEIRGRLLDRQEACLRSVRELDTLAEEDRAEVVRRASVLYRDLSFVTKWLGQVEEARFKLTV
jgi:DnaJ-domain-containing protein 1